ncbi:MAG TPA: acyl-CoA synthetase [Sphingopyxis sp.]|uniref:acyl-CoA synthetase n=1 Tax=Sphingopyxis sp. TaxID=1908224 RepID=UPI002E2F15F9|nr:acyl-CoA synthetase [Sphingopyxis sp.]HEX2813996.1 acyl-CoA synthetase [Sphingopyxis sp.]
MHPRFHAETFPDKAAVIRSDTGEALTYGALEARANRGAHLFRSLGIAAGDTIAIWLPNRLEYYEVYWAAQRAGLYITPLSTKLTAEEAAYILTDSSSRLLVTSGEIDQLGALLEKAPSALRHIYTVGARVADLPDWGTIADFPATPIADESAGFHMVYSSGTTGRPKGIRLPLSGGPATEPHMLAERQQSRYGAGPHSVYLSPAPLYHTAPLAFTTSIQRLGGTVILMPRFTPEDALAAIEKYRVTITQMVPTMFVRMLRLPDTQRAAYDISSLTHVIHAAAPCPVEVKERMIEWFGPIIYEYYGGSEGNGSTFITPQEWLRKKGSVGCADWGAIHICDEDGRELPPGEQGLIYFEGGWDFQYLNDVEKTKESRHPHHSGWSALGDIGYLDADGYLFLTDRKSFMIISGGVNIYPQEVENLLIVHPKVADAAVIGVPSAEMGEEVKAVVQPRDAAAAGLEFEAELIAYCRAHLSAVKCPRSIDFVAELPRHETGKLYKREIRDRYWAGHEKRVA